MSQQRRQLRAVCPGVIGKLSKGMPYHYPGERPDVCPDCRPKQSFWKKMMRFAVGAGGASSW